MSSRVRYLLLWCSLVVAGCFFCCTNLRAQEILLANGNALPRKHCYADTLIPIMGRPGQGYFSGCGIVRIDSQWYFNPVAAAAGSRIFPHACDLMYIVHDDTAHAFMRVQIPVIISPPLRDTGVCDGQIYLTASTLYATYYEYSWEPAAPLARPDTMKTRGRITETTTFRLTVLDPGTGCSGQDSMTATLYPTPVVSAGPDAHVLAGQPVQLQASGASSYFWSPGEGLNNPYIPDPVAEPVRSRVYTVTGTNEYGCRDTASVSVEIDDALFIPDAFTPNGDGLNDIFRIVNFGYHKLISFLVCDRYGNVVFQTSKGASGWDGTVSGQPAAAGTYYFMVHAVGPDGDNFQKKGSVQLIR